MKWFATWKRMPIRDVKVATDKCFLEMALLKFENRKARFS